LEAEPRNQRSPERAVTKQGVSFPHLSCQNFSVTSRGEMNSPNRKNPHVSSFTRTLRRKRLQLGCFGLVLGWACAALTMESSDGEHLARLHFSVATPGGLTANEVAQRAQATGLTILAQGQALAAAQARLEQALAAFLPKLTLTARYTRLSLYKQPALQTLPRGALDPVATDPRVAANPSTAALAQDMIQAYDNAASVGSRFPVIPNQYLLQAGLIIPVSDYAFRLSWQYAAASHSVRAAALEQRAAGATTSADARVLYYTWLQAVAHQLVAERSLAQAKQHLEDSELNFRAGLVPDADVSRVRAQVAKAELVLQNSRNVAALRAEQIKMVMHDTSQRKYVPGEDLSRNLGSYAISDSVNSLQAEALVNRLEIRALDETAWSLSKEAKAEAASSWPQLSIFGDVITARPNSRIIPAVDEFRTSWDFGAQLVWIPSDVPGANALASESRAKSEQVKFQKAALRDNVALEVFESYQHVKQAVLAVETSLRELESAEENYNARRELFRSGQATSAELTDAELDWTRAQLDVIDNLADLRIARVHLDHATGRDIK